MTSRYISTLLYASRYDEAFIAFENYDSLDSRKNNSSASQKKSSSETGSVTSNTPPIDPIDASTSPESLTQSIDSSLPWRTHQSLSRPCVNSLLQAVTHGAPSLINDRLQKLLQYAESNQVSLAYGNLHAAFMACVQNQYAQTAVALFSVIKRFHPAEVNARTIACLFTVLSNQPKELTGVVIFDVLQYAKSSKLSLDAACFSTAIAALISMDELSAAQMLYASAECQFALNPQLIAAYLSLYVKTKDLDGAIEHVRQISSQPRKVRRKPTGLLLV